MNLIWNIIRFIQRSGVALKNQTLKNINRIRRPYWLLRKKCFSRVLFPKANRTGAIDREEKPVHRYG